MSIIFIFGPQAIAQAPPATAPAAPTGLTSTAVSSAQINLSWTASSTGGSPITGYKIEYKIGSGAYSVLAANTANTTTSYSHTGLTASTAYTYRVSAINSIGTGTTSAEATATTQAPPATAPAAPTGLTSTAVSSAQINLSWTAPSNGGSPITGYKIEYKIGSGAYSVLAANTANTTTSYSHTGLIPSTAYTYRVSAINAIGTSTPSTEASATTQALATVPAAPTGLTATAVSTTRINLSWTAPSTGGSPITGYKIEIKIPPGDYTILAANTANTTTSYSHAGLTTGKTYIYRVSAINSIGTGTPSAEVSAIAATLPNPPTGLTATAVSTTGINLYWTAPNNGGSPITGYKIEYKIGSGAYSVLAANTANTTVSYSYTGLKGNTTYTYRVSAINSVGTGTTSAEATATTPTSVPNPPAGLTATAVSTRINLSWTAPSNTGGLPITGYKIEKKVSEGAYQTIVKNTGNATTSYFINGLTAGTTYTFVVSAINSIGTSNPSKEASATTPTTTVPNPPTTVPNPPTTVPNPPTTTPSPPTDLTATGKENDNEINNVKATHTKTKSDDFDINDAKKKNTIIAEVNINNENIDAHSLVSNFTINTEHSTKDTVSIAVSATNQTGPKVVLVNLNSTDINVANVKYMDIKYDGNKIAPAANVTAILHPTNSDQPYYAILVTQSGAQILILIPHFSTHIITIGTISKIMPSIVPEFNTIAMLVLTLSLLLIIGFSVTVRGQRSLFKKN
ncbi:MAG TPA: fibronectin type III domain-containing protein [Nitrosopumilaceae archaeon]|nr:fibronectin type III domain-containing protein [Nitrosopumilaceae archaeon]